LYQFRDPIHGFIEVTKLERDLINSAPFQRLRNIKQLATTYLVYHGAEHTRFGHSLGVTHLVSKAFDTVLSKNPELFDEHRRKWYRQILRLLALTHDLGHAPFSHASEDLFVDGRKHEDYTRDILFTAEITGCIRAIGEELVRETQCDKYDITPELLWLIYNGEVLDDMYIMPDFRFLKSFMDGALDCDKMDYLIRDSYFCGVKYGDYDIDRLVSSFTAYRNIGENSLLLAVEHGGIHALEEFVLARYFMFVQVYYHKTRRFMDKRLVSCLKKILPNGKYPIDICEYLEWDDMKVIHESKTYKGVPFSENYLKRKVMSCVHQTSVHAGKNETQLFKLIENTLKEEIIKLAMIDGELIDHVVIDEVSKEVHEISKKLDDENSVPIIIEHRENPSTIYDESLLLKDIPPISIKRIYVADEHKKLAESIISRMES